MSMKRAIAAVSSVLLALGGVSGGEAQAAPMQYEVPASPVGQPPQSPMGVQNAVRAAQQYLSIGAFSRSGLIDQLVTGDGYSTEDATSAVNSLTVDWNQQAAKAAKQYLSIGAFSRSGLIDQLMTGDGYTMAQAQYGVAAVGY